MDSLRRQGRPRINVTPRGSDVVTGAAVTTREQSVRVVAAVGVRLDADVEGAASDVDVNGVARTHDDLIVV